MFDSKEYTEEGFCDKHGIQVFSVITYNDLTFKTCPKCEEERKKEENPPIPDVFDLEPHRRKKEKIQRLIKNSGIPKRYLHATLKNAKPLIEAKSLHLCHEYAKDFDRSLDAGRNMVFMGGVGTGKTFLACAIAMDVISQGYKASYANAGSIVKEIKASYNNKDRTEKDILDDYIYPDLLIIDEVGFQRGSVTEQLILGEIINGRYEESKPIMLLTNSLAKLESCIGEPAMDRMRDCGGTAILFKGKSLRGRMAK